MWPRTSTRVCARPARPRGAACGGRAPLERARRARARRARQSRGDAAPAGGSGEPARGGDARGRGGPRAPSGRRSDAPRRPRSARRAAVEAVDAARRETAHELLNTRAPPRRRARAPERGEGARRARLAASHRARGICRGGGVGDDGGGARGGGVPAEGHGACARAAAREVDALRGEKKHLWERVEYAEWRLAKLGRDKTTSSPEEAAVAARPGGPPGTETEAVSGGRLGASRGESRKAAGSFRGRITRRRITRNAS